jgi:hypothetical protein
MVSFIIFQELVEMIRAKKAAQTAAAAKKK